MSVHPSICLSTLSGVLRPGSGGGYPCREVPCEVLCQGVPYLGYPPSDLAEGVPCQGVTPTWVPPGHTWLGVPCWGIPHLGHPPLDLAKALPCWGIPHLRYPLSDLPGGPARGPAGGTCWGVVPHLGYPCQTWAPARGTCWGYPTSGTPLQTW